MGLDSLQELPREGASPGVPLGGARRAVDDGFTVTVRPEPVVEIAFGGVQRSPRCPKGVTLRFARVLLHREARGAAQADTVEALLAHAG